MKGRLVMLANAEMKKELFDKAHRTRYTMHPGTTKMYKDLKGHVWQNDMLRKIVKYVAKNSTCQPVGWGES